MPLDPLVAIPPRVRCAMNHRRGVPDTAPLNSLLKQGRCFCLWAQSAVHGLHRAVAERLDATVPGGTANTRAPSAQCPHQASAMPVQRPAPPQAKNGRQAAQRQRHARPAPAPLSCSPCPRAPGDSCSGRRPDADRTLRNWGACSQAGETTVGKRREANDGRQTTGGKRREANDGRHTTGHQRRDTNDGIQGGGGAGKTPPRHATVLRLLVYLEPLQRVVPALVDCTALGAGDIQHHHIRGWAEQRQPSILAPQCALGVVPSVKLAMLDGRSQVETARSPTGRCDWTCRDVDARAAAEAGRGDSAGGGPRGRLLRSGLGDRVCQDRACLGGGARHPRSSGITGSTERLAEARQCSWLTGRAMHHLGTDGDQILTMTCWTIQGGTGHARATPAPCPRHARATPSQQLPIARATPAPCPRHVRATVLFPQGCPCAPPRPQSFQRLLDDGLLRASLAGRCLPRQGAQRGAAQSLSGSTESCLGRNWPGMYENGGEHGCSRQGVSFCWTGCVR
eukprot:gene3469-biopygen20230